MHVPRHAMPCHARACAKKRSTRTLGRWKREKRREEREEKKRTMRAPALHAHTLASVERPLTLHFVVGVFYASYCLSFSAPLPSTLDPHIPPPYLTLDAPGTKKNRVFFTLLFLHDTAIRHPARFLRPFSTGLFTCRYLRCKSKRAPSFSLFFIAQNSRRSINDSGNRVVEPSASVHSNEALVRSLFRKIYSWKSKAFFSRNVEILLEYSYNEYLVIDFYLIYN